MARLTEIFRISEDAFDNLINAASRKIPRDMYYGQIVNKGYGLLMVNRAVGGATKEDKYSYEVTVWPRMAQHSEPLQVLAKMQQLDSHFDGEKVRSREGTTKFYRILSGDFLESVNERDFEELKNAWESKVPSGGVERTQPTNPWR